MALMSVRELWVAGAILLAVLSACPGAVAQMLYLPTTSRGVERDRDHELDNDEINRADCDRDEVIRFHVAVTGVVSNALAFQVWRGNGCADGDRRFEDSSNCVQIPVPASRSEQYLNVDIAVRRMLSATKSNTNATGGGGGGGEPTHEACEGDPSFPLPSEFSLHFVLVDGNGDQPSSDYAPAVWTARYDLIGPPMPQAVGATPAEGALVLSWAIDDERGDIDHYNVYCDPPPTATIGDDGAGGQGSAESDRCPTALFGRSTPPAPAPLARIIRTERPPSPQPAQWPCTRGDGRANDEIAPERLAESDGLGQVACRPGSRPVKIPLSQSLSATRRVTPSVVVS